MLGVVHGLARRALDHALADLLSDVVWQQTDELSEGGRMMECLNRTGERRTRWRYSLINAQLIFAMPGAARYGTREGQRGTALSGRVERYVLWSNLIDAPDSADSRLIMSPPLPIMKPT